MKLTAFVSVLFLVFSAALSAQTAFPSLDAVPAAHEYSRRIASGGTVSGGRGGRTGNAYWKDLSEAALWASSVNAGPGAEEKAAAFAGRITAAAEELSAELAAAGLSANPRERGEYALAFIHRRFLKSYSEHQTRLDEIFVSGRYNCVSSAVLYMILGLSAGLDISGVMTKDHAFAVLDTGTERIDVETTNPYGFDPGNRKEFLDGFGKVTGFAYVPARNYRDRSEVSAAELVSLILSNRIAVLEKANRFAEAVPLAVNRAALLGGASSAQAAEHQNKSAFFEDPHRDMMNRLFNLGAHLVKTGKEDDAAAWAHHALSRFPDPRWQDLVNTAVNNKLVKLIRSKKTADARAALTAYREKLAEENYNALDVMVLEAEAGDRVNGIRNPGDAEAALAFLSQAREKLSGQYRELVTAAVLKEAERIGKSRDWTAGMRWLADSMEKYGSSPRLETALRTFRQNRIGELHNGFAALYNKKDYAGAKAAAERALQEFPGERQLTQDLALAERALRQ